MSRNLAASVRARLKNRADAGREDFNLVLTRFGLERLLFRLSISAHADRFLLKGALLFSVWHDAPRRPTRDLDLLGLGPGDVTSVVTMFREICAVACEDGVRFDPESVSGSEIREEAGYGGVRLGVNAEIDGAQLSLQIDVGFGDAVTPGPERIDYPILLDDLPAVRLRAYPRYSVVAEKLEVILALGIANSRMKDYFDLWILLRAGSLDTATIGRAIAATCKRRGTMIPVGWPLGLSEGFAADVVKQTQWQAFLRKNRLDAPALVRIVADLRDALDAPLRIARGEPA